MPASLVEPGENPPTSRVSRGWSDLARRFGSAAVLAPLALWCVWAGGLWFAVLVAIGAAACGAEWRRLAGLETRGIGTILIIAPIFVVVAGQFVLPGAGLVVLAFALVLAVLAFGSPWQERKWAVIALPHVCLAALAMLFLRLWPEWGRELAIFLLATVWLSDIGGYFVGRLVGGAKLAPRISPAKTWSGAFGSLAFSVLGAVSFALVFDVAAAGAAFAAALLSVAAQAGDLFESALKRRFGVKDSGRSIPGHGGVLDRVDGILFAAPALAAIVLLFGPEFVQWR